MLSKRIIFIFLLICIVIGAISAASANDLTSEIVSNSSDDEIGIYNPADDMPEDENEDNSDYGSEPLLASSGKGTFTELQNNIKNAAKGSTIYLTKDYCYNTDFKGKNGITIDKPLTIDGKGHVIDGKGKTTLLLINNGQKITLKNIVFKNGNNKYAGIVSVVNSKNIKFDSCDFKENEAGSGTVYLDHDDYVSFVNCLFDENSVKYCGGAAFISNSAHTSFTKCYFDSNYAKTTGGAIYLDSSKDSKFDSCLFIYNEAADAGAVFLTEDTDTRFVKCNFETNYADYMGGAVYLDKSKNPDFKSCTINLNYAYEYGGAVYLDSAINSNFKSCSFNGNSAPASIGGAISANNTNINIDSCIFDGNSALNGGSISAQKSYIIMSNSKISGSEAEEGVGGGIYSVSSALKILNTDFAHGSTGVAGSDIYSQYGMVFLENTTFNQSFSMGFGGSLVFNDDYVELENCSFNECCAYTNGGGAIYSLNSVLNSHSSKFTSCVSYYGGAICSLNTDLAIRNNAFDGCMAVNYGGAIYNIYGSINIDNSRFLLSTAYYGGAIYLRSPHKIHGITNNLFLYSSATLGSKIYLDEYYGEIPESGNIYEDVYFVVGEFNGSNINDEISYNHEILTYIISNANNYQAPLAFYDDLKNSFMEDMEFPGPSDNYVSVELYDEEYKNNSTIFLNYKNHDPRKLAYNIFHEYDNLNYRDMKITFYNLDGNVLTYLDVISLMVESTNENNELYNNTFLLYSDNSTETTGWWTSPIFDNKTKVTEAKDADGRTLWLYSLDDEDFSSTSLNGELYFNLEDEQLCADYGNVYEFKSIDSTVPLINYTPSTDYLPESYDSRNYGYITPVQDQGIGSNCWAFSGIATLEACLKKATGQTYNFSENNAKNMMAVSSIYGLNIDPNAGGYDTMFMGYLASWLGPVYDEADEYNPLSALSIDLASVYHIQDISFLPTRKDSSDNDEYKKAIMNNGAISVILNWTGPNTSYGLHSICIVGWNDSYNGIDSLGNPAEGAWIFKNSWGDEWGDEGFGYLSYKQQLSGEIAPYMNAYTFIFNERDIGYQDLYQYDFAGLTDYLHTDTDCIYYKNKFTAKDEGFISAFSTYFERPTVFDYTITINGKENCTVQNVYSPAGYHTIQLEEYQQLNKSDEFEIIIKLHNDGANNIPVCQADELYKSTYPGNVSFISYNGKDWIDLNNLESSYNFIYTGTKVNTSQVACIKAFTTKCRMNLTPLAVSMKTPEGTLLSQVFDVYILNVHPFTQSPFNKTINMKIPEWSGDEEYENFVEVFINEEVHYVKISNEGTAKLNINFDNEGNYSFSAKVKSNHYSSNLVQFNFTVVDTIIEDNSSSGTFSDLEILIESAKEGSTITLKKDYYYDEKYDQCIPIEKSITIDGNGHILDGILESCIFDITNEKCVVDLINITFRNGNSSAITSNGLLNIFSCNFTNNYGTFGGAINSAGNCTITDSTFNDNNAVFGGAIHSIAECIITDSHFTKNSAAYGGAISSNGPLYISNCTFKNNSAEEGGGAFNLHGECYLRQSVFEANTANYGGVVSSENDTHISNCTFKNNSATGWAGGAIFSTDPGLCNITQSIFESNSALNSGGAIMSFNSTIISKSTFKNNTADEGGAIYSMDDTCNINQSIFESNSAEKGGAICAEGDVSISDSTFKDNRGKNGGAVYAGYDCNITNSLFDNNTAVNGGAIYSESILFIPDHYDEFENYPDDYGEEFLGKSITDAKSYGDEDDEEEEDMEPSENTGPTYAKNGECHIINSAFNKNSAQWGGAIFSNGECHIINSTFDTNFASYGGAIYSKTNRYSNDEENEENGDDEEDEDDDESDWDRYEDYPDYDFDDILGKSLKDTQPYGNDESSTKLDTFCIITNSTFENNVALCGGAIYYEDDNETDPTSSPNLIISASDFTFNYALNNGGTIFTKNTFDIQHSKFKPLLTEILYMDDISIYDSSYFKNNKIVMIIISPLLMYGKNNYYPTLHLVFSNTSIIKGQTGKICQLKDNDGNEYGINAINLTLTNKGNQKTLNFEVAYNEKLGGYILNTSTLDYGTYKTDGNLLRYSQEYTITPGTLNIVKKSALKAPSVTGVYGKTKLTITLKDDQGNAITNNYIYVKIDGKTYKTKTNSKGQATITLNLAAKTYTATVTFKGNTKSSSATIKTKVTIKKATPKILAGKKTYMLKSTKKYTVTLKNNLGKVMKNTLVIIKIKGKTYKIKTNSKGQVTFNLKALTKTGTFTATIKYNGDKYYNAVTKKVTITVKK